MHLFRALLVDVGRSAAGRRLDSFAARIPALALFRTVFAGRGGRAFILVRRFHRRLSASRRHRSLATFVFATGRRFVPILQQIDEGITEWLKIEVLYREFWFFCCQSITGMYKNAGLRVDQFLYIPLKLKHLLGRSCIQESNEVKNVTTISKTLLWPET